jgi:hypothetical protein
MGYTDARSNNMRLYAKIDKKKMIAFHEKAHKNLEIYPKNPLN